MVAYLQRSVKTCGAVSLLLAATSQMSALQLAAEARSTARSSWLRKNYDLDVSFIIIVDDATELAAAKYDSVITPISPLTSDIVSFISFNLALQRPCQVGGASFVVGGIKYCFFQMWCRRGEAKKIGLMGDGRSKLGSSAIARTDLFRSIGGDVSVVAARFPGDAELLAIAVGTADHVFVLEDFLMCFHYRQSLKIL